MSISMYSASVPVFRQMLNALNEVLAKAEAHATAKSIEPGALLQDRLFPDMFPLFRQVQIAADFAKSVPARLANIDVPAYDDTEQSFAELRARISKTLAFIDGIQPEQFDGSEQLEIVLAARYAQREKTERPNLSAALRLAAVLLPRHHRLRDPAPQRRRDRQARLHGQLLSYQTLASCALLAQVSTCRDTGLQSSQPGWAHLLSQRAGDDASIAEFSPGKDDKVLHLQRAPLAQCAPPP